MFYTCRESNQLVAESLYWLHHRCSDQHLVNSNNFGNLHEFDSRCCQVQILNLTHVNISSESILLTLRIYLLIRSKITELIKLQEGAIFSAYFLMTWDVKYNVLIFTTLYGYCRIHTKIQSCPNKMCFVR